ncbi:polysaccharide transporter, PST family/teichuronic acid exporter/lipopolysaccharide exporter [Desulfoluna spongiiphila]|uniref:Polysaccharide transporter, PST family/teichuronic acid exporter/lipopolysaccharide exporter n=2 Tax=Desulfoluna spongiiphila TaxID=419481 RepID=A0A1G5JNE5_9BACT|nr:polysaccharide transporter, PST family/teichuronic acid exporter/lipopolysaccharide exporter [Desulfoluna spongiiphila]
MVMVVIGFAQAFTDMGLSNAIIHHQDTTEDQLSSLYWLNILAGVTIFAIVCISAPLAEAFYKEPGLDRMVYLTALIFLLTPLGQQFQVLIQKELQFDRLAKIDIACSAVNSIVCITLAYNGYGVYALIWGQIIRTLTRVLFLSLFGRRYWRPRFHFRRSDLNGYLRFGFYQMGERAINYLSANVDYLIIGHRMGPTALGYYTLAYQLAIFPLIKINPVITRVAFPIFSKIQGDNSGLQKGYCSIVNLISTVSFPMMAGMILVAPEFISVCIGDQWEPSIILLEILCIVGALKSLGNPIGSIILAKGKANLGFFFNLIAITIVSTAVLIGSQWGITSVAVAILVAQFILLSFLHPLANKLISLRLSSYLRAIETPFFCTLVMIAVAYTLKTGIHSWNAPVLFGTTVIIGVATYITAYYFADKKRTMEFIAIVRNY